MYSFVFIERYQWCIRWCNWLPRPWKHMFWHQDQLSIPFTRSVMMHFIENFVVQPSFRVTSLLQYFQFHGLERYQWCIKQCNWFPMLWKHIFLHQDQLCIPIIKEVMMYFSEKFVVQPSFSITLLLLYLQFHFLERYQWCIKWCNWLPRPWKHMFWHQDQLCIPNCKEVTMLVKSLLIRPSFSVTLLFQYFQFHVLKRYQWLHQMV